MLDGPGNILSLSERVTGLYTDLVGCLVFRYDIRVTDQAMKVFASDPA